MNNKNLYLIILMFLGFILYTEWQKDYGPKTVSNDAVSSQTITTPNMDSLVDDVPSATSPTNEDIPQPLNNNAITDSDLPAVQAGGSATKVIAEVETPLLKLEFAAKGAALVYAELKKYPLKKANEAVHVVLMDHRNNKFKMDAGLVTQGVNFTHNDVYQTNTPSVQINDTVTSIEFTHQKPEGTLVKRYEIDPNSYAIKVTQTLTNNTGENWNVSEYQQLMRNNPWLGNDPSFTDAGKYSFKGVGFFDSEEGYETRDFDEIQEGVMNINLGQDAWVAMVQHYFFAGVIPSTNQAQLLTKYRPNNTHPYLAQIVTNNKAVNAGATTAFESTWYVGPKLQKELPQIAKGLDLTVDYGVFTAISKPLFWVLEKIHSVVGNWGWAIVLLTVLIKLLFFKLSEAQYKSMARMRQLQPRITVLKERYKDDKQKFNQEMMGLYQKEKVNPLGGCLPILIQIPVFIALYWVLLESVELRQAPFILWLQDLSSPDPYFILPAINAAAMIMTQRLSPTPGMDPMQAKIMKAMPIVFSIMFAFFQSGLVLYWAVNSVLSLAQQWVITKRIEAQDDNKKPVSS
ncbi:membrane protein insertase YidC [Marinicella sp. S1101]|uniref:membrane protein insertase YidC n=1 Tax=Marinicella marina TaxID=2996016 RepID=UPI002260E6F9|nr:membrane protein insertase YidC [Marinicella marina]MCX7553165.1 membrane protein insertase YidC [Marinicella marina]MDJ1138897.1 membrane protein insertase YidC [Marinicella marina]